MNKQKLLLILIFSFFAISFYAKEFRMWGNPYVGIQSYNGITSNGYFTMVVKENWGTALYAENWRITVRLTGDIVSSDGSKVFPSNKVGFILTSTDGQPPSTIPNASEIGLSYPVMLNGMQEIDLVNGSLKPLSNKVGNNFEYFQFQMNLQLTAVGGGYLDVLDDDAGNSTITYTAPFEFKAYIGEEEFIINHTYDILQVHKLSTNKNYSILVNPVNVDLEFNTMTDYISGKSISFSNALTVKSNVDYQVRVSSIYPNFYSALGTVLPLDIVRLQLSGNSQTTTPMMLSDTMVTLLHDTSTGGNSKQFDLIFTTMANDSRLLNIPNEQFSTNLLFEITPQ